MNAFEWLRKRRTSGGPRQTAIPIEPSHVDAGPSGLPAAGGGPHCRIWLCEVSLNSELEWFSAWEPAVYCMVRFRDEEQEQLATHLAGRALLKGLDQAAVGRPAALCYDLTGLLPATRGVVEIETGLVAVPASSAITTLLNVLGSLSGLLAGSRVRETAGVADTLTNGIMELVGAADAKPVLRFHDTFGITGSSGRPLRPGYFLVAPETAAPLDPQQLWIQEGRVRYGPTSNQAKALARSAYMLLRVDAPAADDRPREGTRSKKTTQPPEEHIAAGEGAPERSGEFPFAFEAAFEPPPPDSVIVRRTPHMDVVSAQAIRPGATFKAKVFADQQAARAGEDTGDIEVRVSRDTPRVDMEVWIAGTSHFEFRGARVQPFVLDVKNPGNEKGAEFDVTVRDGITSAADARLVANFSYNGRASGHVSVAVAIELDAAVTAPVPAAPEPGPAASPPVEARDVIRVSTEAAAPDLTIEITDPDNTKQHLHCRVSSPHLPASERPEPFNWNLDQQAGQLVEGYMSEFVKPGLTNQQRLANLKGAGRQLWDATPKRFREIFWKLVDLGKLETIFIVSEDPYIPWELMIPHRPNERLRPPLGADFVVGRWLPTDFVAPRQELVLSRSLVIAPDYPGPQPKPLKEAKSEADLVLTTVVGEKVDPATLAEVTRKLERGTATLVHFVCHGAVGSTIGIQIIHLLNGQLTSLQVLGMDELAEAFRSRPLVFLNACEVGRLSTALVGVGGFAKAFIDLGASAVIAPLWSVRDSVAHKIAKSFYDGLATGQPVRPAEIFRKVRAKAYDVSDPDAAGEDTYAAYCFYGDPSTTAVVPPKGGPQ